MPVNPLINLLNKSRVRIIKFWLPVLVWMVFIFYASCLPGNNIPFLFSFQGITYHLLVYSVLSLLFYWALKKTYTNLTPSRIIIFTIIFGIIYGISDELHQAFVPYRSVSGFDIFIDGIGSFAGSLLGFYNPCF